MLTMHPIVLHGCTTWDQERLPLDEFGERVRSVQRVMKDNGLSGLIVYGDCRDYSKLCYLTNYIPKHSWAMVLVPAFGNPYLLAKVAGTRDIPSVRLLTWIDDIRPAKNIAGEVDQFIKQITDGQNDRSAKPTIGICGGEQMGHSLYTEVTAGGQRYTLKTMDTILDRILQHKRPRETAVIREASSLLKSAVNAMQEIHRRGGSVVTAVIEAERVARYLGAQDVRVLYSLDSGHSLQPFEILSEIRNDPMIAYIAVEYLGYWAEAMVTLTRKQSPVYDKAVEILNFFTTSIKSGVKIETLVRKAAEKVKPYQLHPLTQNGFGHCIGLSLEEKPVLHLSYGENKMENGSVYTIHAGLTDNEQDNVLLSTMILVNQSGNEILWSSI